MVMSLFALLPMVLQDPTADMQRRLAQLEQRIREIEAENENLREVNRALQDYADGADGQLTQLAAEIFRLREGVGEAGTPGPGPEIPAVHPVAEPNNAGPEEAIRAEVLAISQESPVLVLDVGEAHGVMPGYRFEIVRNDRRVAIVEVERTITEDGTKSRARIIEGRIRDILIGDRAIAFVRATTTTESPVSAPRPPARITGMLNNSYVVNLGRQDGTDIGAQLWIYRGGIRMGTLRVQYVDRDWSLATPEEGMPQEGLLEGDEVMPREIPRVVVGRIRAIREDRGVFIDVGTAAGAFTGQRLRVSRLGAAVGEIEIVDAREFYSIAQPAGETGMDDLHNEDFVEPSTP